MNKYIIVKYGPTLSACCKLLVVWIYLNCNFVFSNENASYFNEYNFLTKHALNDFFWTAFEEGIYNGIVDKNKQIDVKLIDQKAKNSLISCEQAKAHIESNDGAQISRIFESLPLQQFFTHDYRDLGRHIFDQKNRTWFDRVTGQNNKINRIEEGKFEESCVQELSRLTGIKGAMYIGNLYGVAAYNKDGTSAGFEYKQEEYENNVLVNRCRDKSKLKHAPNYVYQFYRCAHDIIALLENFNEKSKKYRDSNREIGVKENFYINGNHRENVYMR